MSNEPIAGVNPKNPGLPGFDNLNAVQMQQLVNPDLFTMGGMFGTPYRTGALPGTLQGLGSALGAYGSYKSANVAEDALDFEKNAYYKDRPNTLKTTNLALNNQFAGGLARQGVVGEEAAAEMAQYKSEYNVT